MLITFVTFATMRKLCWHSCGRLLYFANCAPFAFHLLFLLLLFLSFFLCLFFLFFFHVLSVPFFLRSFLSLSLFHVQYFTFSLSLSLSVCVCVCVCLFLSWLFAAFVGVFCVLSVALRLIAFSISPKNMKSPPVFSLPLRHSGQVFPSHRLCLLSSSLSLLLPLFALVIACSWFGSELLVIQQMWGHSLYEFCSQQQNLRVHRHLTQVAILGKSLGAFISG